MQYNREQPYIGGEIAWSSVDSGFGHRSGQSNDIELVYAAYPTSTSIKVQE